ncbi:serine/threonine protein kinase [Streptomyces sp. SR27]|uniref:serine/threonine protein kinase n=1 Tax=Streptomyces sp. SR27 TaxID=3076630 RepID=UPI003FA361D3
MERARTQQESARRIGPYRLITRLDPSRPGSPLPCRRFVARSEDGEQTVLLITPLPGTDPSRFAVEADAGRRLIGPWIAPVTAMAGPGETPWYATPYVPALPLPVALAVHGGTLPEATVRAVGATLAEALAAAHGQGLTHAGVSPAAVLLTADGPRLTCYGAVRAASADGEPRTARTRARRAPRQLPRARGAPPPPAPTGSSPPRCGPTAPAGSPARRRSRPPRRHRSSSSAR